MTMAVTAGRELRQRLVQELEEARGRTLLLVAPLSDEDRYGRKLRIVMVDGESVGDTLVGEGLARWYEGGRRPWC